MLPEAETYAERLKDRRTELLKALDGLDADALNWRPLAEGTNSIAVIAAHAVGSEKQWLHQFVGQKQVERNRKAEFTTRAEDGAAYVDSLKAIYAAVALESQDVLAALQAADLDAVRTTTQGPRTVRWAILHSLEHYSEHLAQIWLTRQLWDNRSARPHEI